METSSSSQTGFKLFRAQVASKLYDVASKLALERDGTTYEVQRGVIGSVWEDHPFSPESVTQLVQIGPDKTRFLKRPVKKTLVEIRDITGHLCGGETSETLAVYCKDDRVGQLTDSFLQELKAQHKLGRVYNPWYNSSN